MKNIKFIVILPGILATACSNLPKIHCEQGLVNFNNDKVSLEIEVLLPESYSQSGHSNYPVLYLLDGFWNKNFIKAAYNDLRFDNMVPEIIIVSIGYPQTVNDLEQQRLWDLTPAYDAGFRAGGNASAMLSLLTEEAIPFIEKTYRVDTDRTILTGHSLAGLFTLYTMYENPELFTHYAAVSPSALWANQALAEIDHEYSENNSALATHLYITYGTEEYTPYVESLKSYILQLERQHYEGLNLSLANVEGLRHVGMKSEGFIRAIVWALQDRKPQGPSKFEKMNKDNQ